MTLTPKKVIILVALAAAGYFAYTMFKEKFASRTNDDLMAMYGQGGTQAGLAFGELKLRVSNGKIKAGDVVKFANDANVDIADLALTLLGDLGCKEQIPMYISKVQARDHKKWKVNAAAAHALEKTACPDSKKAIPPLIDSLKWQVPSKDGVDGNDATEKVHAASHAALKEITGENWKDQYDQWNTWWKEHEKDFRFKPR